MATWNQNINSGGFLAGIGGMNENAPRASDVNATLGMIRDNNDFARAGGNNVGLQALQGLGGLADAYKQNQQAERQKAFQQEYGNAFKSGDRNAMRDLAAKYPDQFENVQKGMGFIDDDHRTTMGDLAMNAQVAAGQGPEAFDNFLKTNADELNRIGVNPADVGQTYQQDPKGASDLFGNLAMFSLGPKGYLEALDAREKNKLTARGQDITARGQDLDNARGWANINNTTLDRAQRAQFHSDNVGLKLQELSAKQAELGKIDPKLVRDLNSDINGYSKNYSAMRSAAENLQALGKRNTPAAQLGMIFNYMKSLDPQSVVREGEQVQVKRTDGIYGTLGNYVSQLSSGKMLNDSQVADLINTSKLMANTEGSKFNQQMDDYLSSYGSSLPNGLVNQLQSRKAKFFDDVPGSQGSAGGGTTVNPPPGSISEGATATNPSTGQKIIFRGGQWQPM
ncbi:phage DNA ejection protein [Symbiopectobacterium sp. Eva_TO]